MGELLDYPAAFLAGGIDSHSLGLRLQVGQALFTGFEGTSRCNHRMPPIVVRNGGGAMTGWMWFLPTVIGIVVLGAALYYGLRKTEEFERDPKAVRETEAATKRLYEDEEQTREGR
ncbi:MAG: hypothetical protein R3D44_08100 [Hyphomicrobiaceae bacterium]